MKKKVLFVINNLNCGGAEKALISLLQLMDYSRYEVDLLLLKKEGLFLENVPKEVHVLPSPKEMRYFDMSIKRALIDSLKQFRWDVFFARIGAVYVLKTERNVNVREQKMWKFLSFCLKKVDKKYDVAIGYLQKTPNYFCIEKVTASKKIAFVHTDYKQAKMDSSIDHPYFSKFDDIVTVSETCKQILEEEFPECLPKLSVMHNIVSSTLIRKMADEPIETLDGQVTLISIGRLVELKGYDLIVAAGRILRESGVTNFKWYIIGEGPMRAQLDDMIAQQQLQNHFVFLGVKDNPYPYIKNVDVVVHASRFEGKSIAIDEAKILNKPIVVTNFETVFDQIEHGVNGLIVSMTSAEIANAIQRILNHSDLKRTLVSNLEKEQKGNESEIDVLYSLLNKK